MITREGRGLAVAAVVFGVAGLVLRFPELLALALVAVLALVVAAGWLLAAPDVTISREITPARVVEGDEARGVLAVVNEGRRRCPPILAGEQVAGQTINIALPSIGVGSRFEASYPLPTGRRGVFEVGPLTLGHSDPLRLVSVARAYPARSVLRVHPRVHVVAPLPTRGSTDLDGAMSSSAATGGVVFHSLRDYVRGDDLRLVHWRSSARAGTLMVRHNVVPNEPRMLLVLDTGTEPYDGDSFDDFDDAVRVVASLAVSACARGYSVDVRTTAGERVGGGRGHGSAEPILDLCAAVSPAGDDPGLPALYRMIADAGGASAGGVALGVVTGQASAQRLAVVSTVRSRFATVSVVRVGARPGQPAPVVAGALVFDVRDSEDFAARWDTRVGR
jgi:uncharacterized protein (DUF58 family)